MITLTLVADGCWNGIHHAEPIERRLLGRSPESPSSCLNSAFVWWAISSRATLRSLSESAFEPAARKHHHQPISVDIHYAVSVVTIELHAAIKDGREAADLWLILTIG